MSENTPGGNFPPPDEQPHDTSAAPPPGPPPGGTTPPSPAPGYGPPPSAPSPAPGYGPPPAAPPPPAPGYGPPPAAPPPPAPGYQAPPPGYGAPAYQPGYGTPPPPSSADIVMAGVKYGWKKFTENVGPWLLGGLVWFVGLSVIASILWFAVIGAAFSSADVYSYGDVTAVSGGLSFLGTLVFTGVVMLLAVLVQAAFLNAALLVASGRRLEFGDFFHFPNFGKVFVTALLVGLAQGVGFALLWVPGLVVMFFFSFAIIFALDRGLGAVDAVKASIDLAKNNAGVVVLMLIAVWIVTAIGGALCGVGLLAAYPVAFVTTAYVYRRLQNQQVAP